MFYSRFPLYLPQKTVLDEVTLLKDVPHFWQKPSYVFFGEGEPHHLDLYYGHPSYTEYPATPPTLTRFRVSSSLSEGTWEYYAGVFYQKESFPGLSLVAFALRRVDPSRLVLATVRKVYPITEDQWNTDYAEFQTTVDQELIDYVEASGGSWVVFPLLPDTSDPNAPVPSDPIETPVDPNPCGCIACEDVPPIWGLAP